MTEQNWWKVAATGLTLAAGVGIAAAALYGLHNEFANSQNQQQLEYYDFSRTNRNRNQPRNGRPSNVGNDDFSSENRRKQLERQEKLIELREERQKQWEKDQKEKEEREREKKALEATRKRLEEEMELEKERQKQLVNDQRIKNEEEKLRKKTQEMESILQSFDDAFDEEIGVRTKIEYVDGDFDDFRNNISKQQRKEEYRRKQHAKNQKIQNDKEEMNKLNNVNVVMHMTNKSCDTRQSQSTYLNQGIDSSQDISQEFEESDD